MGLTKIGGAVNIKLCLLHIYWIIFLGPIEIVANIFERRPGMDTYRTYIRFHIL